MRRIVGYEHMTILGLSGSLRRGSFNSMLLRNVAEMAPAGTTIEIGTIEGIPLYNGDVEDQGIPDTVQQLKNRIVATDALLIVTPEYNNSMPGVLKNALDWASRPNSDVPKVFRNRPVAIMGASPGLRGTALAQVAWLPVLRTLGVAPWFGGAVMVANAKTVFAADGTIVDQATRDHVQKFINGFAEFVAERRR
jgi:chromate reductase, NAD(P)H dehydrogenase (quinone)